MKDGLGVFNLRFVGIVFIGTLVALLGMKDATSLSATMGILGAIAGYLFGLKEK